MKWASAIAVQMTAEAAVLDVCDSLRTQLAGESPQLLLVFASPHYREAFVRLPSLLLAQFPGATLIGCSGGGIIGTSRLGDSLEVERGPALAVTAAVLPGVQLTTFHYELNDLPKSPEAWHAVVPPSTNPAFLLLPEPYSCDLEQLITGLDAAYPGAATAGGVASGGRGAGDHALFEGSTMYRDGVVGVALSGNVVMDTLVAQGCRPIGAPSIITRCERNLLLELGGQPALPVLKQLFETLDPQERQLFRSSLFLGIQMKDDQLEYQHGDFLIRNVLGVEPDRNAVVVGAMLTPYQAVQFHLRDADASAEDLRKHLVLHRQSRPTPQGALLFSCLGRGEGLYGRSGYDSQLFAQHMGPVPLTGFFCNGEIGPVSGTTFVHGYTSSFALLSPRN